MEKRAAQRIVNEVLAELEGRSGFDIINMIMDDKEIYEDLYGTCVTRVQEAWDAANKAADDGTEDTVEDSRFYPVRWLPTHKRTEFR